MIRNSMGILTCSIPVTEYATFLGDKQLVMELVMSYHTAMKDNR